MCFDDINSDNYPELKNNVIMMMIDCCARDPYDRPRFIDLKRSLLDPFLPNSPRTNQKISTVTSPIPVNPPTPSHNTNSNTVNLPTPPHKKDDGTFSSEISKQDPHSDPAINDKGLYCHCGGICDSSGCYCKQRGIACAGNCDCSCSGSGNKRNVVKQCGGGTFNIKDSNKIQSSNETTNDGYFTSKAGFSIRL